MVNASVSKTARLSVFLCETKPWDCITKVETPKQLCKKMETVRRLEMVFLWALPLKGINRHHMRHTPYSWRSQNRLCYSIVFQFLSFSIVVRSFSTLCSFSPTHPPCFCLYFLATGWVAERFISFDVLWFIFRVFGSGNKLLSWPKTNCVVNVLLAGTIHKKWDFWDLCHLTKIMQGPYFSDHSPPLVLMTTTTSMTTMMTPPTPDKYTIDCI